MFDALMHTEDGEFYWERSSSGKYADVETPAYFGTWGNVNFIDALGAFRGFQHVATPHKKLIVGPPVSPTARPGSTRGRSSAGMTAGLRGRRPASRTTRRCACMSWASIAGATRRARRWTGQRWTPFYLHPAGWLQEYPPAAREGTTSGCAR